MKVRRSNRGLLGAILLAKREASEHNGNRVKKPNSSSTGNAGSPVYSETIGRAIELHKLEKEGHTRPNREHDDKKAITQAVVTEPKRNTEAEESILEALKTYKKNAWVKRQASEITITVTDSEIRVTGRIDSSITRDAVQDCIKDWQRKNRNTLPLKNQLAVSSQQISRPYKSNRGKDRRARFGKLFNRSKLI